jgi:lauroyl/myristoyl acyltransferase
VDHRPDFVSWQRRLLGRLHFTGVFWYRLHAWAMRVLPRPLVAPCVFAFAAFFWLALRGVARAVGHNLEWVRQERASWPRRQGWAFRTIHQHAWCMTETYDGLVGRAGPTEVELEGAEHWQRVAGAAKGFVLVTAHVGHWEVGSRLAPTGLRRKVHVVRAEEIDPDAQEFLRRLLRDGGGDSFEFHFTRAEDPSLGARLLLALRRGEVVALQGDRGRPGQRAVEVTLFGRPHAAPLGPAALARAAEVPILPVFVFRRGRSRSLVSFHPPIEVRRSADRTEDHRLATAEIVRAVESAIRREPHQWFCFRDLWGRRPVTGSGDRVETPK